MDKLEAEQGSPKLEMHAFDEPADDLPRLFGMSFVASSCRATRFGQFDARVGACHFFFEGNKIQVH